MIGVGRGSHRSDREHDDEEGVVGRPVLERSRRERERRREQKSSEYGRRDAGKDLVGREAGADDPRRAGGNDRHGGEQQEYRDRHLARARRVLHLADGHVSEDPCACREPEDREKPPEGGPDQDQDADARDRVEGNPFRRERETQNDPENGHADPEGPAALSGIEPEQGEDHIGEE